MKKKVCFIILVVGFLVSYLDLGTALAWEMNDWVGKWFKLTFKQVGKEFQEISPGVFGFVLDNESHSLYLQITGWDSGDRTIHAVAHTLDCDANGVPSECKWETDPIDFFFIAGSTLDFHILFPRRPDPEEKDEWAVFTARITGKLDKTRSALKSAAFNTLGGVYWEVKGETLGAAGSWSLNGPLVPASKVPPEILGP
jgi:hypothetical protein